MVTYDRTDPNHWYHRLMRIRGALEQAGYYVAANKMRKEIQHTISDTDCIVVCDRWQRRLDRALALAGPNPNPGFSRKMPDDACNVP